jgi:hypothetical protein
VQRLGGVNVHVDADQVDQCARPQRPAGPVRHRLVQFLRRHTGLVEHAYAVVQEGDQDPVDDEARRVLTAHRLLAGPFCPLVGGVDGLVGTLARAHDLDERQHRRGVEEVHSHDALRVPGRRSDLRDGQSRRVSCKHCVGPRDGVQLGEDVALQVQLLEHGLHDEVAAGEVGQFGRQRQATERRLALRVGETSFLHTPS